MPTTTWGSPLLAPYAALGDGMLLYYTELAKTGDAAGGNCDLNFTTQLPPATDPGLQAELWFPLWFSYRGRASQTIRVIHTSAIKRAAGAYSTDSALLGLDTLGSPNPSELAGILRFLRKPYFPRDVAALQQGWNFSDANVDAEQYRGSLWVLRCLAGDINFRALLELVLSL